MKTLSLFLIWLLTRLAWELAQHTEAASRFEPLLSDAEVMAQTDTKEALGLVVKSWVEA